MMGVLKEYSILIKCSGCVWSTETEMIMTRVLHDQPQLCPLWVLLKRLVRIVFSMFIYMSLYMFVAT